MDLAKRLEHIRSSPKLQSQQQSAVVLSAIEDTLRSQKAEFTPASYFAALISLLGQLCPTGQDVSNNDLSSAVVYLLDLVTPHVSVSLLRSKFSQILSILTPALVNPNATAAFSRSAISCLGSLLLVQESEVWMTAADQPGARLAFSNILMLAMDHRPKVRKAALDALSSVLLKPPSPLLVHPASEQASQLALRAFFETIAPESSKIPLRNARIKDPGLQGPNIIHSLHLLKAIAASLPRWPARSLEGLYRMLKTATQSSETYAKVAALEVIQAVFKNTTTDKPVENFPELLKVILDVQPPKTEAGTIKIWLHVIALGYTSFAEAESSSAFAGLPDILARISQTLYSHLKDVRAAAGACAVELLERCVPSHVILTPSAQDRETFQKLSKVLASLLTPKYHLAWNQVAEILSAAFIGCRVQSKTYLCSLLATIGELRATDVFTGKREADEIISKAIRAMGPEAALDILPLNLTDPSNGRQGRAWMVPLLRDSIMNTSLNHFKTALLPMSEEIEQKIGIASSAGAEIEAKIFETLAMQIWATLPGYCDRPTDLTSAFDQSFAELLSNRLYQRPELRTPICQALRMLIVSFNIEDDDLSAITQLQESSISLRQAKENIEFLSSFAPNLLAVLFNVYNETAPSQRAPILSCIDAYLSILKPDELTSIFERVCGLLEGQLSSSQENSITRPEQTNGANPTNTTGLGHSLMDIVVTAAIYLGRESYTRLFTLAANVVARSVDAGLQKKAYKLIPRLAKSQIGLQALADRSAELQQMLLGSVDTLTVSARGDRVLAISTLVGLLSPDDLHFIPSILPEVVLATKESNERARQDAFDTIITMGEKLSGGGTLDHSKIANVSSTTSMSAATLEEFFTMLSAGLAGSTPHAVSATIAAIARALYHFKSQLSEVVIREMLETVSLFFHSPNREIVGSVLGFVKVCVISLQPALILSRLQVLISNLLVWSKEHKAHFSAKVKHILERMMRRFGADIVERNTPEDGHRLLKSIRKARERRKRNKLSDTAAHDHDNDGTQASAAAQFDTKYDEVMYGSEDDSLQSDEEASGSNTAHGTQLPGRKSDTLIVEDDDPLDLLDQNAIGKIGPKRLLGSRRTPNRRFNAHSDADGKLVFASGNPETHTDDMSGFTDAMQQDPSEDGVGAYVEAIRGQNVAVRGQRGRLKFNNRRSRGLQEDPVDDGNDGLGLKLNDRGSRTHPASRPRGVSKSSRGKYRRR